MDARLDSLLVWLRSVFKRDDISVAPASADASFRRYFRTAIAGRSYIIMDAPPDKEDTRPYLRIAAMLQAMGLNVPVVLEENLVQGYFLLTDLGTQQYLQALNVTTVETLYADATTALLRMQQQGQAYQQQLPAYDHTLLWNEMQLFRDWYLQRHLQVALTATQQLTLDAAWQYLIAAALQQPQVFVHRDYHSRNLMYCNTEQGGNPGVLDFQDAVQGPVTYDLVSLVRDCYIAWPRTQVENWVQQYHAKSRAAGMLQQVSADQFLAWFDLMGIQRHLKASGIFARLNYRDGKDGYLKEIPRTLGYVLEVAGTYPALQPFLQLLHELNIPARLQQECSVAGVIPA